MMELREVLQRSNFGQRVAEDESSELEHYFVETDQWRRILAGEVDIIYGPKGAGKSAVYSLLIRKVDDLRDRSVSIISAEKPRGTPVFKDLQQNPPTTEDEFIGMWKLYFLSLIADTLEDSGEPNTRKLIAELAKEGLSIPNNSLAQKLHAVAGYVKSVFRPESVEGGVNIDPTTGFPTGFTGKISFRNVTSDSGGVVSINDLLFTANEALRISGTSLWILLDRLDVAFTETPELEENALRALFRVYLDILDLDHICPKVFLRTDIWLRITRKGFREASHITRAVTIEWNNKTLLNLIIRRTLKNECIVEYYGIAVDDVLSDISNQETTFYRLFPDQVDVGSRKSTTFDWILSRCSDGSSRPAPREIIHLLNLARNNRLREFEVGVGDADSEHLFSRSSLKSALPDVSSARLHQTLLAEYPHLRGYVESLKGEKTEQYPATLSRIWKADNDGAIEIAKQLVDAGFFESRGTTTAPIYWVPFLYRDATEMIQGKADS